MLQHVTNIKRGERIMAHFPLGGSWIKQDHSRRCSVTQRIVVVTVTWLFIDAFPYFSLIPPCLPLLLVRRLAVAFYIIFSCAPLKPDYAMRLRIVSLYESVQAIMSSKHCTLYMIRLNVVSLSCTFNLLIFLIPANISSY